MPQTDVDPILSAENVRIRFGRTVVVDHLDIRIAPGSFTALVGPNGSGKSTILRALAGLIRLEAGTIRLAGRPLAGLSTRAVARQVGVLAQGPTAPEGLTVIDLVRQGRYPHRPLFGRWSGADEEACVEAMDLTGTRDLRDRALDSLSGGQRQRAWIAMCLAQETVILLLDEPTTFLDIAHQIELLNLLAGLNRRGRTLVAVLHDLNQAARYASNLVAMKHGAVVAQGAPDRIVTAELVSTVFGVEALVIPDPITGTPMVVPKRREWPHA